MTQQLVDHRRKPQQRILCPLRQFDSSVNNIWSHIKGKHPEDWEKWRDYHLEWNSEVPLVNWLKSEYR